jgi:murein DD-endopeptidase MepM/ murein hydrolase activator NlpD
MKRYIFVIMSFFICMQNFSVVYADTLSQILNLYGTSTEVIDIDNFMLELEKARSEYKHLKNEYAKDEYFRRTEEVADMLDFQEKNLARKLDTDKKYLQSLVNINADLQLIFEAENDYRNSLMEYRNSPVAREKFSIENYTLSGTSTNEINQSVDKVHELEEKISVAKLRPDIGSFSNLKSPTKGVWNLTSSFAYRTDPINEKKHQFHNGIDLAAPQGNDVLGLFSGKVMKAGDFGDGYGNCVLISHSNEFQTFYAHMESVSVHTGDMISQYDVIGKVGSTGRSTGPHLHLSVYIDGNKVDPIKLFEGGEAK